MHLKANSTQGDRREIIMKKYSVIMVLGFAAMALVSCGKNSGAGAQDGTLPSAKGLVGSCLVHGGGEDVQLCLEYSGMNLSFAQVAKICEAGGAKASEKACPSANLVGSCMLPAGRDGVASVERFYQPMTREEVSMACKYAGGKEI